MTSFQNSISNKHFIHDQYLVGGRRIPHDLDRIAGWLALVNARALDLWLATSLKQREEIITGENNYMYMSS